MDGEDDPGESSSGSWKESKETWSCNTRRTMTRGVCLDAAPRAMVSIIIQGTLPFLNLYADATLSRALRRYSIVIDRSPLRHVSGTP